MRPAAIRAVFIGYCTISALLPINSFAADGIRERFDLIEFGMSRQSVLLLMPPTAEIAERTTFGMTFELVRWQASSRGPAYTVRFIAGRVYAKATCDRPTDC